jgi:nicotinamidase-related amidase
MRILKENTIGLIIDFQERLCPAMYENEKLLNTTKILVEGLQQLDIPLLITQQYTKGLGETIPEIKSIISSFEPIEKSAFSCCDEPTLIQKLSELNAKNVIIIGIESHVCVLQTAVDLKETGYNPIVVMDCVSSRKPESIEAAKERFRFEGIMMTSMESILFELTRSSKDEGFRAISKLVK